MPIINYMYGKIIKNCIKDAFGKEFELKPVSNYLDFFNCLDGFLLENNLKCWEPDLEKNVVHLLIQSLKNSDVLDFLKSENTSLNDEVIESDSSDTLSDNREINSLYSRLCQLDPILALDI